MSGRRPSGSVLSRFGEVDGGLEKGEARHRVGFDMPVRRIVSIRPCPEPSPGTMRARQACFLRLRGWPATRSRCSRCPSESPVSVLVDFLPICLVSHFAGRSQRRRENNVTLPEEMELLVLSHTLVSQRPLERPAAALPRVVNRERPAWRVCAEHVAQMAAA